MFPDISDCNTAKVEDMSGMFNNCSSLILLLDILKWDTIKIKFIFIIYKPYYFQNIIILLI